MIEGHSFSYIVKLIATEVSDAKNLTRFKRELDIFIDIKNIQSIIISSG